MNLLSGFTDASTQSAEVILDDGTVAVLTLTYRPQQMGWFYNLAWTGNGASFTVNGRRLVTSPNILRQFKHQIPFGIMVDVADGSEPTQQADLATGRARLYLLTTADIASIDAAIYPGP